MAVVLAPGQTAANSTNIVVTEADPMIVTIYTDTNGVTVPPAINLEVHRQNAAGNFAPYGAYPYGLVNLTHGINTITLTIPGTYRVVRADISAHEVNVGVDATASA